MLLTITATASDRVTDATDLGYLLHKHPGRLQRFDVTGGTAHVFYSEATPDRCTAALVLEVDPIALARGRGTQAAFALGQYVNDRPYAASSLLSVAIGRVFKTALSGRCNARPELATAPIALSLVMPCVPCGGDPALLRDLFEPLGWTVTATLVPLDQTLPEWGASRFAHLRLDGTIRLADALNHLYVLIPVLDDAKHYWVDDSEVDKLVRAGAGWLSTHPQRELITRRYLAHQRSLVDPALERLADLDDVVVEPDPDADAPAPLAAQRRSAVVDELITCGAHSVLDLGCGPGALLADLLKNPAFTSVTGTDVSHRSLQHAARRLHVEAMTERQDERLTLLQSSLTYRDLRLTGHDAAVLMEVVEHLEPDRIETMTRAVFGDIHPATVVVTTPNRDHNALYAGLAPGELRHRDHRFEWDRAEFAAWAAQVCLAHGYTVRHRGVGGDDPALGPATQMAVFTRG